MASTVYLLHFERPFKHAQHYAGYTRKESLEDRLHRHRTGKGAKLMRAVTSAGIGFVVARVWTNAPRNYELTLKQGSLRPKCPICTPTATGKTRGSYKRRKLENDQS